MNAVFAAILRWIYAPRPDEEGDVPGWVMVVLMTAGLVVLIWAFAGEALTRLFQDAIERVTGAG